MSDYWLIFKHRFYMGKTKIFKRHFFTTYIFKIIWTFLVNLKSVCTMVILIIRILLMLCILHIIENLYLLRKSLIGNPKPWGWSLKLMAGRTRHWQTQAVGIQHDTIWIIVNVLHFQDKKLWTDMQRIIYRLLP